MIKVVKLEEVKKFLIRESKKRSWTKDDYKSAFLISKNLFIDSNKILSEAKFNRAWTQLFGVIDKVIKKESNTVASEIKGIEELDEIEKKLVPIVEREFREKVVPVIKQLIEEKIEFKVREVLSKMLQQ